MSIGVCNEMSIHGQNTLKHIIIRFDEIDAHRK